MNHREANEQQQNALLLVFYMLVMMTLLVIRAGLVARGMTGFLTPGGEFCHDDAPVDPDRPLSEPPEHLYPQALRLLYAAELVARRLTELICAAYEFLKQPPEPGASARDPVLAIANLCKLAAKRLDSS